MKLSMKHKNLMNENSGVSPARHKTERKRIVSQMMNDLGAFVLFCLCVVVFYAILAFIK